MSITDPTDAQIVAEHLARYAEPQKLALHLRGIHQARVTGIDESGLAALRALHQAAHEKHTAEAAAAALTR